MQPLLPSIDSLSLAQQVAQMIVVRASGYLFDHQIRYPVWEPTTDQLESWIHDRGVGGVILLGGSAAEVALRTQQLQEWATIPLLLAADVEEGIGQRFAGATWFPPPMALAAIAQQDMDAARLYATQLGEITAQEAQAIGLNWVLAPVVDVNNNPNNPVINVRAFGDTPSVVSQLTTAFIQGSQRYPILTAAKHFPGHGDTAVDSHLELPVMPHSLERLRTVELLPFQAAIAAGVDAVMSAHLQIPSLDVDYPATLSPRILTAELRQNLGFEGLIVTDALVMGAIANRYGANQAPVMAVAAGADILLMPIDPVGAIEAICAAVEAGEIEADRIRASVERIWHAKQKVCSSLTPDTTSHAWETLPPTVAATNLVTSLAAPTAQTVVTNILQASMQVYSPAVSGLTETGMEQYRNLIVVDDCLNGDGLGHHTPAIALPAAHNYTLQLVDRHTISLPQVDQTQWSPTLLQLFIRGNPFRGSAGLTETAQCWFDFLQQTEQLHALIVYGSPYILEKFLPTLPPTVPYVFSYGQMPAAQAIALKAIYPNW